MANKVLNKTQLLNILFNNGKQIRSFGIDRIGVFGSFVRDTDIHKKSDVDFVIDFKKGKKTPDNLFDLGFFLEDILGRKVELITRESLRPPYGPKILKTVEDVRIG